MKKLTTEEFIKKAKKIHGNKYDYSKVEYINNRTKICIICPEHGEFWQTPNDHLDSCGCPKCFNENKRGKSNKLTKELFILRARELYGDKYDYSKVEYNDCNKKVCIICPEHGEFWQTPNNHLNCRNQCPKCVHRSYKKTTEEFIEEAKKIHKDKYDYSKVEYEHENDKVCIICPEHGEFWQTPKTHLNGCGCPKCANIENGFNKRLPLKTFINRANEIHNSKYDYSKVEYKNTETKVCIICPEHGEFWQTPHNHISQKQGCPFCKESHLAKEIKQFLIEKNILFEQEKGFDWLKNKRERYTCWLNETF